MPLDNKCYTKDGNIYCKDDYYRLFAGSRCSRCQRGIYAQELVMRAREHVYHLHCFTCAACNNPLHQGERFGLRDHLVYCAPHFEMLAAESRYGGCGETAGGDPPYPPPQGLMPLPDSMGATPVFAGVVGTGRKGRPRKKKDDNLRHGLSPLDPSGCGLHLGGMEGGSSQASPPLQGGGGQGGRTKRMRTSFKHHQLRTMKSYFAINQNPDAKDLKQLAQKTGLSKRVLQVWFQNARAKWRRSNGKQDSLGGLLPDRPPSPPQLHHHLCSPGSSYSEPSPSQGGHSDGSVSGVQGGPHAADFDSSDTPLTPIPMHHLGNSEHVQFTSFHELF